MNFLDIDPRLISQETVDLQDHEFDRMLDSMKFITEEGVRVGMNSS